MRGTGLLGLAFFLRPGTNMISLEQVRILIMNDYKQYTMHIRVFFLPKPCLLYLTVWCCMQFWQTT